ncbi:MAG TPA: hypothetical protein VHX44_18335 [Planctomycetota bacterium]|nr:hypothetical protein [Planctomycetota bacterium]
MRPSAILCLALTALMVVVGCSPRVPEVPASARGQTPRSAPLTPWVGKGRLEVVAPGKRLSGTAILRSLGDGAVRAAFLSDEGLLLADLTAKDGAWTVARSVADMERALPHLGRLVAQAYARIDDHERTWDDDRLRAQAGDTVRWYGGDPVLLRAVEGGGLDLLLEDWRMFGTDLLPYEARAEGPFGITIRLRLTEVTPGANKP